LRDRPRRLLLVSVGTTFRTDTCCGSAAVAAYNGFVAVTVRCDCTAAAALRGPLLAAVVVLPAARDALDERRLVGTAASDLNTLAGARGGTVGATLRT
jgi:hypothetical protein